MDWAELDSAGRSMDSSEMKTGSPAEASDCNSHSSSC